MRIWTAIPLILPCTVAVALSQRSPVTPLSNCRLPPELVRLPGLAEASGVAASRRTPGVFWAHNDSGEAVLVILDSKGAVKGRVRVTGASVDDWEDIAVGPCPQGSCVYVADIGDNPGRRTHVTIYRTAEPAPSDAATAPVEPFTASYPDGPHDAESLFVTSDAQIYLVTKGSPGAVAVYRFPGPLKAGVKTRLERVGAPLANDEVEPGNRPTAADASPDGKLVAVRTTEWVAFYPAADFIAGRFREAFRTDLRPLDEPRGEGVTFAGDGAVVLVGEGGGLFGREGTFAWLSCTFAQK